MIPALGMILYRLVRFTITVVAIYLEFIGFQGSSFLSCTPPLQGGGLGYTRLPYKVNHF